MGDRFVTWLALTEVWSKALKLAQRKVLNQWLDGCSDFEI